MCIKINIFFAVINNVLLYVKVTNRNIFRLGYSHTLAVGIINCSVQGKQKKLYTKATVVVMLQQNTDAYDTIGR